MRPPLFVPRALVALAQSPVLTGLLPLRELEALFLGK